ncbi:MAG: hypothetical protein J7J06_06020, partial [Methanosarcinales archaeon]|nr:hypothetical protein [Methanosarcinales archaeon]
MMEVQQPIRIIEEIAKALNMGRERLEMESLKTFLEKELIGIDAKIYKIGAKHGIKSIFELDEKLRRGIITEEEMMDDFMELDYLESR